jgi:membrane protein YqaA with SNARE-associated domain
MESLLQTVLHLLALPEYGLLTVFVVSFVSATLLPLGSEPAVLGLIQLNP